MSNQTAVYEEKMKKTLAALESEFATIRVGRANPKVLDRITVDYYGTPTPLNTTVSMPGSSCHPWNSARSKGSSAAASLTEVPGMRKRRPRVWWQGSMRPGSFRERSP